MKSNHMSILHQPIETLTTSPALARFMKSYRFEDLKTMLSTHTAEDLLRKEGFDCHCLVDLYDLLAEYGCEEELRG